MAGVQPATHFPCCEAARFRAWFSFTVQVCRCRSCDRASALQSACSVDRIDSALATVLPLVPGLAYFRFCCEDPRCGIELDEIDPEQWALLEVGSHAPAAGAAGDAWGHDAL